MGFRTVVKKVPFLRVIAAKCQYIFYCSLTLISPELNTRMRYRQSYHKKLNLNNPKTFSEKLLWLKLRNYMNNPMVIQCADKYRVREYIKQCGYEDILVKLYDVYEKVEDIDWKTLPESFVLKWNYGAGFNIIGFDKSQLDQSKVMIQLHKWGRKRYWLSHSEMQYKHVPKRIICEEYLCQPDIKTIPDYKVYCFHGKPKAILVMHDRGEEIKSEFFDCSWNRLKNSGKYREPEKISPKPKVLEKMLEVSKHLSDPFPFVRCDFYVVNDRLYFGEMTFTPAGGLHASETVIDGISMADMLHI